MSSLGARALLELPADLGRLIHEFVFRPVLGAHPERVALPSPLHDGSDAVQAIAIERGLLGPAAGRVDAQLCLGQIEWQSPLHRMALLPREVLEALAWYLGLAAFRDRLRRIVMRDEIRALHAEGLSAEHLAFVYQLPELAGERRSPEGRLGTESGAVTANWPQQILGRGWGVLGAVRSRLPAPIAVRFQFKLPPGVPEPVDEGTSVLPDPLFDWIRERVVNAWRPDFDARLAALAAPPGRQV